MHPCWSLPAWVRCTYMRVYIGTDMVVSLCVPWSPEPRMSVLAKVISSLPENETQNRDILWRCECWRSLFSATWRDLVPGDSNLHTHRHKSLRRHMWIGFIRLRIWISGETLLSTLIYLRVPYKRRNSWKSWETIIVTRRQCSQLNFCRYYLS